MWYIWVLLLLSYLALTWRSLKEASLPLLSCPVESSSSSLTSASSETIQQTSCFRPAVVVGDTIVLQLELFQPMSKNGPFRWIPVETCRVNTTIPPSGKLPQLLTKQQSTLSNFTNNTTNTSTVTQTDTEEKLLQATSQTCIVSLPDFARHRSPRQDSVHPLKARFLVFQQKYSVDQQCEEEMVGATDPFFLTRIKKRNTNNKFGFGSWNSKEASSSSSYPRNLIQNPFPQSSDSEDATTSNDDAVSTKDSTTTMWIPYLKFGRNTAIRIRFVTEDRGYRVLQRADGITLRPLNATTYSPMMYVDELSLQHSAQVELAPPEDSKPPLQLHIKFGSISPAMDAVNRQVHMAFDTAESFLSGPELDEIRYFLQDERLYRFALTQVISYLHMWLDYLAFRDEIRFYRGRQNLSGVSTTTVLTRLGCSVVIFLYLLDGGGTSWVVLISILASCLTEAWKVWKLLKPTFTSKFPFVAIRQLQSPKERETAEYDRIACRYLAMAMYPLVAIWSLYALKQYEYASWYSWFISNMANAVYTFGFISLCPQLYINYRLKSVAHLPWKVFMYKIFNTFVDDAFAWLIEMPLKHRLMTLRDDVVFVIFLVQVYIYRVDKTRTNEFGYSYENEQEKDERGNEQQQQQQQPSKVQDIASQQESLTRSSPTHNDSTSREQSGHVVVIVLGDLGRSPRMQYHANSLLEAGYSVSLVGYVGEDLIPSLKDIAQEQSGRLNVIRFAVPSPRILKMFLPLYLMWRISSLCLYLLYVLVVQGFTMLSNRAFSKIARVYEAIMAPRATAHLCVTEAMKQFIHEQFSVPAEKVSVLHDCSSSMFRPQTVENNHELLSRLHKELCAACPKSWYHNLDPKRQTLFTEQSDDNNGEFVPRSNRPALVTSSTSWTPDEDFGQLLDALVGLDECITEQELLLKVLVVVTGKGPQKMHFLKKISRLKLANIAIQTLWLEPADYPRLLACADVGISLHTSTSGIDLPMKILDLFGCEVPVCARGFRCLPELVEEDVNGRIFYSKEELQDQLLVLLKPLAKSRGPWPPHGFGDLARYSRSLQGRTKWDENWKEHALPILESAIESAIRKN